MTAWKRVKLGEVAKMMRGKAVTRSSIVPGNVPVMLGGREPAYYCNESNHTGPCFIVSRSGASAGYVSYWDEPIFVTDGFLFESDSKDDTQFLYYSLKARQQSLIMSQNGTGIPHVRGEDLKNIELVFPTEVDRKRIAAILSDYDAAIANCQKQIALLEEAAMRLYREWFGDGKGANWHEETAFDFCDIMSGGTPSTKHSEYYEGKIPFFTPADGHNISCVFDTEKHLSPVGVSHCNSQLFPVGTIMVTARGTVGKVVYNAVPMAMNQSCYAIKPKDACFSPLLLFVMLRNEIRQIQKAGSSGVFDAIKVETFKLLKLKVPNEELAGRCLKVFQHLYCQVEKLSRQIRSLTEARDRLLPKLMKGDIAV